MRRSVVCPVCGDEVTAQVLRKRGCAWSKEPVPIVATCTNGHVAQYPDPLLGQTRSRQVKQKITRGRFGYYVHTTHGIGILEGTPFAFTLRGARRKADRIRRRLERDDERHDAAIRIDNGTPILPDLRTYIDRDLSNWR